MLFARIALGALALPAAAAQEPQQLPPTEIVMPAPLGLGTARDTLPYVADTLRGAALQSDAAANLPEAMALRLRGVSLNDTQGNPFQPDLSFRGFTASPLLGSPQGLSVFLDGVRINESFGDIVNWDLVPQAAIDQLTLLPGSNPLFGLNTLGGAITLRTRSGDSHPGTQLEAYGGSFGRVVGQFESGASFGGGLHGYAAGTYFDERGWRNDSPSQLGQLFGKVGYHGRAADVDLALLTARSNLVGSGLAPQTLLQSSRRAIFTRPDQTRNQLTMATLSAELRLDADTQLTTLAYLRRVHTRTLNGDVNSDYTGLAPDGGFLDDPAVNNRSDTGQTSAGAALQWSAQRRAHRLAAGASYDGSRSTFSQDATPGVFDASRAVLQTGPTVLANALDGRVDNAGVYAADAVTLAPSLTATLAARYNLTRVALSDVGPSAPALDGAHVYAKLNPAFGLAYAWRPALGIFGNFSQGSRAPTPIELGCADPLRPCTLPNALAADPALSQVVTRTGELGARGTLGAVHWSATAFLATSFDDILFVGTTTSAGYFRNFGQTRRRGLELAADGTWGALQWSASYAALVATYASAACIVSPNNSTRGTFAQCSPADPAQPDRTLGDDLIAIAPGDRLPGLPAQSLKLSLAYRVDPGWQIGAELSAFARRYVRGNENNRHQPGSATDLNGVTRTYLGSGSAAGFAALNLSTQLALSSELEFFARLANVFNTRYWTAGALAQNPFAADGQFQSQVADWSRETFYTPGAPRAAWAGLRYRFGA